MQSLNTVLISHPLTDVTITTLTATHLITLFPLASGLLPNKSLQAQSTTNMTTMRNIKMQPCERGESFVASECVTNGGMLIVEQRVEESALEGDMNMHEFHVLTLVTPLVVLNI